MAQSLVQMYMHIIFSTKNRRPLLKNVLNETHAYLSGICKNMECPAIIIGGIDNHVHLLTRHSKKIPLSDFIRDLKRSSSKWIKTLGSGLASFGWQNGYGAFSVSPTHIEVLKKYIATQNEHHKRESFKDEFRRLCKKYGIEIDEQYVWD